MTDPPPAAADERAGSKRRSRWLRWIGAILAGALGALVLIECGFRIRSGGARSDIRFYLKDLDLGVRLAPRSSQKFGVAGNPITTVATNSDGFRGGEFGEQTENEILVVGDSQAFGLGVEEDATFAEQLEKITGRKVINAAVPTYGPLEYTAMVGEILRKRKIVTVVYAINFADDLFEIEQPNRVRHRVRDGRALHAAAAERRGTWSSTAGWLINRSHAAAALRRWFDESGAQADGALIGSEGRWQDIVSIEAELAEEKLRRIESASKNDRHRLAKLATLEIEIRTTRQQIARNLTTLFPGSSAQKLRAAASNVGDPLGQEDSRLNSSRSPRFATTAHIRRAIAYRNALAAQLNAELPSHAAVVEVLESERQTEAQLAALAQKSRISTNVPSALAADIEATKALTDVHGAQLVVVALPIDVQVSTDEWKKYGSAERIDMAPTRVLLADLASSAERLGVRGLDTTAVLKETANAFLPSGTHFSAAGHRAVAEAIAERLNGPAAIAAPRPGLPEGRTRVPRPREWAATPEIEVKGSSAANCETSFIREWFLLACSSLTSRPSAIEVRRGGHSEELIAVTKESANLLMPILAGDEVEIFVAWENEKRVIRGSRPQDSGIPILAFEETDEPGIEQELSAADQHLCDCQREVFELGLRCADAIGAATSECLEAYGDDCEALLSCASGDPLTLPPCPQGRANAGGTGQCFALCSSEAPCASGACTAWRGTHVCF